MDQYFPKGKIVFTGNPVRKDLLDIEAKKEKAQSFFKLDTSRTTVFIVGGSQGGARGGINLAIARNLSELIKKTTFR